MTILLFDTDVTRVLFAVHVTHTTGLLFRIAGITWQSCKQAFQENTDNETSKLDTKSHQQVEGPPLRTYLFHEQDPANRVAEHADRVIEALEQIATQDFPGLTFDNRVAIITPQEDSNFCLELSRALAERLKADGPTHWASKVLGYDREFEIKNAEEASRTLPRQTSEGSSHVERIVVDTIDNFDGLERLIVLCVNLDTEVAAAASQQSGNFASRSVIYRAMTRAHMVVAIINRHVMSGYLEFLLGAKTPGAQAGTAAVEEANQYKENEQTPPKKSAKSKKKAAKHKKKAAKRKSAVGKVIGKEEKISSDDYIKTARTAVQLRQVVTSLWDNRGNDTTLGIPKVVMFSPWKDPSVGVNPGEILVADFDDQVDVNPGDGGSSDVDPPAGPGGGAMHPPVVAEDAPEPPVDIKEPPAEETAPQRVHEDQAAAVPSGGEDDDYSSDTSNPNHPDYWDSHNIGDGNGPDNGWY